MPAAWSVAAAGGRTRQGRQRQRELIGHVPDTVGALLALAALERAVPMERNRPDTGEYGPERSPSYSTYRASSNKPHNRSTTPRPAAGLPHRPSRDRHPRVDADLAPFRLAGEAAKLLPGTHLTQTFRGRWASQSARRAWSCDRCGCAL